MLPNSKRVQLIGVTMLIVSSPLTALADAISVNISGSSATLAPSDSVGVVSVINWNNLAAVGTDPTGITVLNLKNDANVTTTADITTKNFDTSNFGNGPGLYPFGSYPGPDADDATMLNFGAFARGSSSQDVIELAQIPYWKYDVYVYTNQGNVPGRTSDFTIGGNTISLTTINGYSPAPPYTLAGNYVKFSELSAASFTLSVKGYTGGEFQTAIAGLQIVLAPEPGSLGMLLMAMGGVAIMRSRRRN